MTAGLQSRVLEADAKNMRSEMLHVGVEVLERAHFVSHALDGDPRALLHSQQHRFS